MNAGLMSFQDEPMRWHDPRKYTGPEELPHLKIPRDLTATPTLPKAINTPEKNCFMYCGKRVKCPSHAYQ